MGKNERATLEKLETFFGARVIHTADLLHFVDVLLEACRLHVEPDVYMRLHSEVEEIMAEAVRGDWDAIARRAQEEGHYVN